MRYKEDNNNRYRVNFMRATEELMDALTVESFISYLEENAEFEDYTVEYIDGKCVKCRAYDLTEENSKLHKEFLVTEDGRVFYGVSNPCDYILFRSPYLFLVELKTHKGKSIPIAKIRPNQIQGMEK